MGEENLNDFVEKTDWSTDLGDRIPLFKGEAGYTYRVGFLSDPLVRMKTHFVKGKGNLVCKSRPAQKDANGKIIKEATQAVCCKKLGESKWRVGSVIAKYSTDRNGNLSNPPTYAIMLFVFGSDKYENLKMVNSEYPLKDHDVKIKAEGGEYQKMVFANYKEAVWRLPKLGWEATIRAEAEAAAKSLPRVMGKLLTDEQLAEAVGVAATVVEATNVVSQTADMDSLLETIK